MKTVHFSCTQLSLMPLTSSWVSQSNSSLTLNVKRTNFSWMSASRILQCSVCHKPRRGGASSFLQSVRCHVQQLQAGEPGTVALFSSVGSGHVVHLYGCAVMSSSSRCARETFLSLRSHRLNLSSCCETWTACPCFFVLFSWRERFSNSVTSLLRILRVDHVLESEVKFFSRRLKSYERKCKRVWLCHRLCRRSLDRRSAWPKEPSCNETWLLACLHAAML